MRKKLILLGLLLLLAGCVKKEVGGHVRYLYASPERSFLVDIWFKGNKFRFQKIENNTAILVINNGTASYSIDPIRGIYRQVNFSINTKEVEELLKQSLNVDKSAVEKRFPGLNFTERYAGIYKVYVGRGNRTYVEVWVKDKTLARELVITPELNFTTFYYDLRFVEDVPEDLFKVG